MFHQPDILKSYEGRVICNKLILSSIFLLIEEIQGSSFEVILINRKIYPITLGKVL